MLLQELLEKFIDTSYNLHTRIHPVNSYIQAGNTEIFIKREDELSSGISGSKYRKFAGLIPFFKANNFDEIAVIGSAYSNNVVAALQLLNENKIHCKLFLLESHHDKPGGNALFIKMLLRNKDDIFRLKRDEWPEVENIASKYAIAAKEKNNKKVFVLTEGAAVKEAIPGAMTIAQDILLNEKQLNKEFQHIFIDSGTGTSAIGLILGLQFLQVKDRNIYITLIAGDEPFFRAQLEKFTREIQEFTGIPFTALHQNKLHFLKPATAASFGAINATVLEETLKIAKEEGILMEPVYSVKHFYTAKKFIAENNISGHTLIIYNGGSLGLAGFQERFINFV